MELNRLIWVKSGRVYQIKPNQLMGLAFTRKTIDGNTGPFYDDIMFLLYTRNMLTSSNWNIFHVTGPLWGEFTGDRWIPSQRPVTRSFDVFFDLHLKKRLFNQSWRP